MGSSVVDKMVRRSKLEKPNTHFWLFNSLILIFYFFANEAHAATGPNRSLKLQNEVHFLRFSKVIICDYLFICTKYNCVQFQCILFTQTRLPITPIHKIQ